MGQTHLRVCQVQAGSGTSEGVLMPVPLALPADGGGVEWGFANHNGLCTAQKQMDRGHFLRAQRRKGLTQ